MTDRKDNPVIPVGGQVCLEYADICRLLHQRRRSADTATAGGANLVGLLDQMQSNALKAISGGASVAGDLDIATIRSRLSLPVVPGSGSAAAGLPEAVQDRVDVMSMLMAFWLNETDLPEPVRKIISPLSLPLLKLALSDQAFFHNSQHPGRRLLELVHASATGWVYEDEQDGRGYLEKLSELVLQMLEPSLEQTQQIDSCVSGLEQFIEAEAARVAANEKQVIDSVQAREAGKLAQVTVARLINQRVRNSAGLPAVVTGLLGDAWKTILARALLEHGDAGQRWQKLLRLMDTLIWSVQPKHEAAERQALMKAIPELLRGLRNELVDIAYDQHKLGVTLKQLQLSHIHALKGTSETVAEPVAALIPLPMVSPPQEHQPLAVPAQQVLRLNLGDWIKWQVASGRTVQGRLLWKSTASATLVFVSRKGNRLAELTEQDLLQLLISGKVQVLADAGRSLYAAALQAMAVKLQSR